MAERKEISKDLVVVSSEEFPTNSHKSKEEATKRVKESVVIKGKVKQRKPSLGKRMSDSFLKEDSSSVFHYVLTEVLLPAAKDTLSDMISKGVEMLLYGSSGEGYSGRRRDTNRTRVSYSSYYERDKRDRAQPNRRAMHVFDDIIFDRRDEAEEVLTRLCDLVYEYGAASVQDFHDLVGITSSYTDQNWGWTNLATARVVRDRDGFTIRLPRTEEID